VPVGAEGDGAPVLATLRQLVPFDATGGGGP
jgi:hypothetical protein